MKVLITGGSGFIGAWIMRKLLARGVAVKVVDSRISQVLAKGIVAAADFPKIEWISGDVANATEVLGASDGCDLIVHLAAILTPDCQADPIRGAKVNYLGTLNVFEAALKRGHSRVLYMSSASVYGPTDGSRPAPDTQYGVFKLAAERSAHAYFIDHGISSVGFRPLVVYGPGRVTGLSAGPTLACRAAAVAQPYTIPLSGETDFVYVEDVAAVFDAACDAPFNGAHSYNILGEVADMTSFVRSIQKQVPDCKIDIGGPLVPVVARRDCSAPIAGLAQVPVTGIEQGVAHTIRYYRA